MFSYFTATTVPFAVLEQVCSYLWTLGSLIVSWSNVKISQSALYSVSTSSVSHNEVVTMLTLGVVFTLPFIQRQASLRILLFLTIAVLLYRKLSLTNFTVKIVRYKRIR